MGKNNLFFYHDSVFFVNKIGTAPDTQNRFNLLKKQKRCVFRSSVSG